MNEVDFSKVGLKMKQLRSERGITQEQVAKDLNCTVPFVSNVENNRAKLNLRVLLYYSKLCNVSVDTILDAGRDIPPLDEKEHQLNDEMLNVFRGFFCNRKRKDHQDVTHLAGEIISCPFYTQVCKRTCRFLYFVKNP